MDESLLTKVIEHSDPNGRAFLVERLERGMDVADIPCHMDYKAGCEPCEMMGKNLACPPYSPYLPDYIDGAARATAVCYRVPLEQFMNTIPEERYWDAYRMVRGMLYAELLEWRARGHAVAGSGPCDSCPECVALKGGTQCLFPGKRIYSLESMGVSVVLFSERAFGLKLDWSGRDNSAEFVSSIGAVFSVERTGDTKRPS